MFLKLEVRRIDRSCLFKLTWNRQEQISTVRPYPSELFELYTVWQRAYCNFYQTSLRAKLPPLGNEGGQFRIPKDRHRQLVQAETALLLAFHRWLRQEELYEIRTQIIAVSSGANNRSPVNLFMACDRTFAQLPWETWEVGEEFACRIEIVRSPLKITSSVELRNLKPIRRRLRILAILGDDTGLDLDCDRHSLAALTQIAEVKFITWESQQTVTTVKEKIQQALRDKAGWQMLFFAGHSSESELAGGEIAIAPNLTIALGEIESELRIARARGLQFALFNSCNGLSIANTLIDLGLSQVVIMREPVHNRVAQVFLAQFLHALTERKNVRQAISNAIQHLRQKQNLTYPSAHLIPALFCHPDAPMVEIEPWGWQQRLRKWLPNRREAIAAGALCLLSLMPPVRDFLLDKRILVQSVYRDLTAQLPANDASVTLIHIDAKSLSQAQIENPVPMNRQYLSILVDRLVANKAEVIGIDYLFDLPQPKNDPILARSIREAVQQHGTWFVFGTIKQGTEEVKIAAETEIGNPNWTLQGYTEVESFPGYISLLPLTESCTQACPLAYVLAMVQTTIQASAAKPEFRPDLNNKISLRQQLYQHVSNSDRHFDFLQQARLTSLTTKSQYFGQQWLQPIADLSLPPDLVYDRLPAWQLLDGMEIDLADRVAIIGSGGYPEAGLTLGSDNFATSWAIAYWQMRRGLNDSERPFTGSEFLAYMTHNLLQRRLVVPIPQLWTVAIALAIATGIKLNLDRHNLPKKYLCLLLSSSTSMYGLISLQLYISGGILLPWLLPSIAIWTYLLFPFARDANK